MARRNPPTPEQVKALSDALGPEGQHALFHLYVADPKSRVGQLILAYLSVEFQRRQYVESLAGIGIADVDPEKLLTKEETDKEAKKRLDKRTTDAVKQARARAKKRLTKATLPPFSAPLG